MPENKRPLKIESSLAEMKDWLWKRFEVNLGDLRELAIQRALNVRNHFIEKENISSERIFLTESEKHQNSKKNVNHVELRVK